MRILTISNLYPPNIIGGYEIACQDFCQGLADLGHQIEVLASNYGVDVNYRATVRCSYLEQGNKIPTGDSLSIRVKVKRLMNFNDPLGTKNRLVKKWLGIKSVYFDLTNFLVSLWEIWRFQPDVVYFWNLSFVSISPIIATVILRKKMVFHLEDYWLSAALRFNQNQNQGFIEETMKRILSQLIRQRIIEAPFIAVSEHIRQYYLNQGIKGRSVVIYNGLKTISNQQSAISDRRPKTILYIGRLIKDKGIHLIIEALDILQKEGLNDVSLDIVGSGETTYVDELRQLIELFSLSDRVQFLGQKNHEETLTLYPLHSIIVVPSLWDEPFGLVAIEAMSQGCVPVVSSSGALPEIVEDGKTGLVFQKGKANDLAQEIKRLMVDKSLVERLSNEAVILARQQFSIEVKVSEVENFLKKEAGIIPA